MADGRSVVYTRNTIQPRTEYWEDHIPTEVNGTKHAPAREREKCDARPTDAAREPTVRRMYVTRTHTRECPRCKGIESDRSTRRIEERGTEARSAP